MKDETIKEYIKSFGRQETPPPTKVIKKKNQPPKFNPNSALEEALDELNDPILKEYYNNRSK